MSALFLAVDAYNTPGIWSEQHDDDPLPECVIARTDANAHGFDLLAGLITDWRCEDWRQSSTYGMCTACGAIETTLIEATGVRDFSAIGEHHAYPTGYGCELCA